MISYNDFTGYVQNQRGIDLRSNLSQQVAIMAPVHACQFIVAGPGSGKTTVLALRVLKLIFVDGLEPGSIMATTFTRRAAAELRSRILGWGDALRRWMLQHAGSAMTQRLRRLDLNRVVTGTLDSIAEQILREVRAPGTQPPVLVDEFVASSIMLREVVFDLNLHNDPDAQELVRDLDGDHRRVNPGRVVAVLRSMRDRVLHDGANLAQMRAYPDTPGGPHPGKVKLCDALVAYETHLMTTLRLDFAALEREFCDRLRGGQLEAFVEPLRVLLVDEYQDTNLLQEEIYLELARQLIGRQGRSSLTVVGDDDQSLYRFRGATVELFRDFLGRAQQAGLAVQPPVYLQNNYRSTRTIVAFCQDFIGVDPAYRPVRVAGKPQLVSSRNPGYDDFPVLGLFRDEASQLARDLAAFLDQVINGSGFRFVHEARHFVVSLDRPNGGSPGDCALLCSTPNEWAGDRRRLPLLLREELATLGRPIQVFNPRGQPIAQVEDVATLCGLLLLCIDPDSGVQEQLRIPPDIRDQLDSWRARAQQFIATNPAPPRQPQATGPALSLSQFVAAWQTRTPTRRGARWYTDVPLAQLTYQLATWLPRLQNDPEGLVYLEAVLRTMALSDQFATWRSQIVYRDEGSRVLSTKEAMWTVLVPLASGAIEINEDLLETLPPDRLNIMSIHQAKGLEFPLVIVDVGSDFRTNHWTQAFLRFPRDGGNTGRYEDMIRTHSPMGRPGRNPVDRAFDDLIRRYFVAYSRPQDVLVLVGLRALLQRQIQNVATGWTRNGAWPWGAGLNGIHFI